MSNDSNSTSLIQINIISLLLKTDSKFIYAFLKKIELLNSMKYNTFVPAWFKKFKFLDVYVLKKWVSWSNIKVQVCRQWDNKNIEVNERIKQEREATLALNKIVGIENIN